MKKSLVLAMAMALGVTASAYAANPFSDVPAGHWAYDSISKLAAAGVIEGYGDDTFRGDRLMTRYEMAQIVAKAMAKGANVDKLAAEFADELDALGVRVAALEKKSDNVKITGQVRWNYGSSHSDGNKIYNGFATGHSLRTRLNINGKVNDNWNYYAVLENRQDLTNNVGDEETHFTVANLSGRLGGVKVTAGRMYHTVTPLGDIYDEKMDGIEISYGKKIRLGAYYGKLATASWRTGNKGTVAASQGWEKSWGVNLAADLGKHVTVFTGFDKFTDNVRTDKAGNPLNIDDNGIFDIGAMAKFGKFGIDATYLKGNTDSAKKDKGFVATISYGGANYSKPGSWGLEAKYYHLGDGTFVAHTMNGDYGVFSMLNGGAGMKGYKVGGYYTVAKNMRAGIEWYDLKDLEDNNSRARTLWTEFQIKF